VGLTRDNFKKILNENEVLTYVRFEVLMVLTVELLSFGISTCCLIDI
jgi:hypothetical protein